MTSLAILPVMFLAGTFLVAPSSARQEISITLCRPAIPDVLRGGRADFVVLYELCFDREGIVKGLEVIKGFDGVKPPNDCFALWRLSDLAGETGVQLILQWKHGKGWVEQTLVAKRLRLKLHDPNPLGYQKAGQDSGATLGKRKTTPTQVDRAVKAGWQSLDPGYLKSKQFGDR